MGEGEDRQDDAAAHIADSLASIGQRLHLHSLASIGSSIPKIGATFPVSPGFAALCDPKTGTRMDIARRLGRLQSRPTKEQVKYRCEEVRKEVEECEPDLVDKFGEVLLRTVEYFALKMAGEAYTDALRGARQLARVLSEEQEAKLTPKQRDAAEELATGKSDAQIGEALGIGEEAARKRIQGAAKALGYTTPKFRAVVKPPKVNQPARSPGGTDSRKTGNDR